MSNLADWEYAGGWEWQPDRCPADAHFVDWLETIAEKYGYLSIFQMGPGLHHHVGLNAGRHEVFALTACREEMIAYMELSAADPELQSHYQCAFADLYRSRFDDLCDDIFYLPHLGEGLTFDDPARKSERQILYEISAVSPGFVVLYSRSNAFRTRPHLRGVVDEWGKLVGAIRTDFKSLEIYEVG